MGNTGQKGQRRSSGPSQFRRLFRRIAPGGLSSVENGHGSLIPCTNHSGECPVCLEPSDVLLKFSTCSHTACTSCWLTFICTEIESFAMGRLTCIACKERLAPSTVINMLTAASKDPAAYGVSNLVASTSDSTFTFQRALSRYEEFLLRRALSREPEMRWCPNGCGYGLLAHGFQACPQLVCPRPECYGRSFCYNCHRPWSTPTTSTTDEPGEDAPTHVCTASQESRSDAVEGIIAFLGLRQMRRISSVPADRTMTKASPLVQESSGFSPTDGSSTTPRSPDQSSDDGDIRRSSSASQTSIEGEVKACPNCQSLIQKLNDGSCNAMTCTVCSTEFCWLCLQPIGHGHFFSLTGCTVWGKRRLTRRNRLLVLFLLMLGMPLLLALGLVLGIPASILALIICSCSAVSQLPAPNKHVSRLWVLCTFLSSLVWAPLCVGLLTLILVPVCLGYTYIYLPISVLSSLRGSSRAGSAMNPEQVTNYTAGTV